MISLVGIRGSSWWMFCDVIDRGSILVVLKTQVSFLKLGKM